MPRYAIITPARDEEKFLPETIKSVTRQKLKPEQWIIVNDGSKDSTRKILDDIAKKHSWIKAVHLEDRGSRNVGKGVVDAFYTGLGKIHDFDYLVKLDADISFGPRFFWEALRRMESDQSIGMASGNTHTKYGSRLKKDPIHSNNAAAQCRIYRKTCYDDIGGLVRHVGWDTIDKITAQMRGWKTINFKDLQLIMHRPVGKSAGIIKGRFREGFGTYYAGYHPLFAIARGIRQMAGYPFLIGGVLYFIGYLSGFIRKYPRYPDQDFRAFLRKQQLKRLLALHRNI